MAATVSSEKFENGIVVPICICGCEARLQPCTYLQGHFRSVVGDRACVRGREPFSTALAMNRLFANDAASNTPIPIPIEQACCASCYARGAIIETKTYRRIGGDAAGGVILLKALAADENADPNTSVVVATVAPVRHRYWEKFDGAQAARTEARGRDVDLTVLHAGNILCSYEDCDNAFAFPLVDMCSLKPPCQLHDPAVAPRICCMCLRRIQEADSEKTIRRRDLNEPRNMVHKACVLRRF
jgi:hypothetical protein